MMDMGKVTVFLCGVMLLAAFCMPAYAEEGAVTLESLEERVAELEATDGARFAAMWKNGLIVESPDKRFSIKINGRLFNDWAFFSEDSDLEEMFGNTQDGTEFRAAWLHVSGTLYDNVIYKVGFDAASSENALKDAFIGVRKLPVVGTVKVGHFKEPFGLEQLTANKFVTFMERALTNPFTPSRNTGAMASNTFLDNRATWAVGVFRDTGKHGEGAGDGKYAVTGRLTGLPVYEDKGRKLVHVGAAYSHRNPDSVQYKERPEAHMANTYVNTGVVEVDDSLDQFGAELAAVYGPLSVQGEYMHARAETNSHSDFSAYYVMASYFLTGEHRPYKTSSASFSRVKPNKNFSLGENGGFGAWELACRYSHIDLDDGAISGGEQDDVTVGLNWYLNPNMRVMWNYVHADVDHDSYDGESDILQMRFQVDF